MYGPKGLASTLLRSRSDRISVLNVTSSPPTAPYAMEARYSTTLCAVLEADERGNGQGTRPFCDRSVATSHNTGLHRIECVESPVRVTEAGLLVAPLKEAVLTALQFVADEHGDE